MKINQHPEVISKFEAYPKEPKEKLEELRYLIIQTAKEKDIEVLEETLKWGEPSYLTKKGSTIRIDWKTKSPDQYAMYFNCNTSLVSTFKIVFGNVFQYEKNRAIVFSINEKLPTVELKECIELALTYHSVKNLPLLGK